MSSEKVEIRCVFRRERGGGIVAAWNNAPGGRWDTVFYSHIGQHSEGSRGYLRKTHPATPEESVNLLRELTSRGYTVHIRRRLPRR